MGIWPDGAAAQEQKSIFLLSQSGRMARRRCRLGVQKGACGTPVAMPPVEDALLPKTDESLCVGGRLKTKAIRTGVQKGACGTPIGLPKTDRKPVRGRQAENKGNPERAYKKVPVEPAYQHKLIAGNTN